jgi:replicative DNA helicase
VLFFSMEMPARQIAQRLLAMGSNVPMHRMARPRDLQPEDLDALVGTMSAEGTVGRMPLHILDTPDLTPARIAAVSRRACRRLKVKLIVVDYLGLMRPENPRDNRAQQVGNMALRMKQMARALGVPVLLLAQLNRELEQANRRPRLSDLRESGEIEQHADRVLFLHRQQNLPGGDPVWPVELIVAKNRNGPTGDMNLSYVRPVLRFESAAVGC